jgi:subtilisin family serine protease
MTLTRQVMLAAPIPFPRPEWVRRELGGATGRGVRVAVVDSGWDHGLDRIASCVKAGLSFLDSGAPTSDDQDTNGHGTQITWLAARVAPQASYTPIRVFGRSLSTAVSTLLRALAWAVEQRFDVISLSLGTGEPTALTPLYQICERAREANLLVVASMDGSGRGAFPASFDNVVSAASGHFEGPFQFSYCPGELTEFHIGPAIVPVVSLGGRLSIVRGSSFATPQLAGLAALLRQDAPKLNSAAFRAILQRHALPRQEHPR